MLPEAGHNPTSSAAAWSHPIYRLYWRLLSQHGASRGCRVCGLAIWLFSPFTAAMSTRGSGESLVTCMLVGMLAALDSGEMGLVAPITG